ncbi:MAG: hypothetical protein KDE58_01940, partial [Caldilineaceae bacterium]|nr:hypothetical protein [Caldilineaceae bacterium]
RLCVKRFRVSQQELAKGTEDDAMNYSLSIEEVGLPTSLRYVNLFLPGKPSTISKFLTASVISRNSYLHKALIFHKVITRRATCKRLKRSRVAVRKR